MITTGGKVIESINGMKSVGISVEYVICLVDRQEDGEEKLRSDVGVQLRSAFTLSEIEK